LPPRYGPLALSACRQQSLFEGACFLFLAPLFAPLLRVLLWSVFVCPYPPFKQLPQIRFMSLPHVSNLVSPFLNLFRRLGAPRHLLPVSSLPLFFFPIFPHNHYLPLSFFPCGLPFSPTFGDFLCLSHDLNFRFIEFF